ncbi:hypothetical protein AAG906_022717 [Vitis piasezkii]
MSSQKFEVEKFNGSNDFTLWKLKMKALLVQLKCAQAIEGEEKLQAHSTILLSLAMKFEGSRMKLCVPKKSATSALSKRRLHTLKMSEGMRSYENFVDTMMYDRDSILINDRNGGGRSKSRSKSKANRPQRRRELVGSNGNLCESWILDLGASYHMAYSRDLFTTFKEWSGSVKLGDDGELVVKAMNLISVGTLDKNGYTFSRSGGVLRVSKGALVVMKGDSDMRFTLMGSSVLGAKKDNCTELWHRRLGHMSEKGLSILSKQGLLSGAETGKLKFCETCVMGKQRRVKFSMGSHTTNGVLEYIHSDLWGPSPVESHSGCRYYVTFIDDFSRKVWVHRTVRHTPQQNGVAERMNQTLVQRARCMRIDAGLSKNFWAEAVNTAAYLVNRSPSTAIDFKTPQEVWSGKPSNYSGLKIFGCPAYAHVSDGKLEPRAMKCIFLGYAIGVKGYRLWKEFGDLAGTSKTDLGANQKVEFEVDAPMENGVDDTSKNSP